MNQTLRLLMLVVIVTTSLYGNDDCMKQVRKEIYPSLFKGGRQVWKLLYPYRKVPPFFCPPQGAVPKNPSDEELKKVDMAVNYVKWKSATWLMFYMLRPTCEQWAKNLMQSKQNNKDSNQTLDENNEEKGKEVVFVGYKGMPLITFNTCYNALETCGDSLCLARATNLSAGESVTQATVDTTIEMVTGVTYNAITYGLCKVARILQIQNPFDAEDEFYQQVKKVVPYCVKIGIGMFYHSLLDKIQVHNNRNT